MMTDRKPKTMDAYVRVSRVGGREGPGYISPTVQREAIERWAEYKQIEIVEWHTDEDESGGTHDRPGLERAVERAVAGHTGGIVSWRIDRFSRFTEGGLRDLRRLQDKDARLVFVVEDIDTSAPMGRFVYTVMLAMSEYVLETLKAGWVTAKARAVERGAHIGPTPLGYVRNGDGILNVHPERGEIVTEAFAVAARDGLGAAVDYLSGLGLVHERGKRKGRPLSFTAYTTRRLLSTRTYLGDVRYGDDLSHDEAHDELVSDEVFAAVQRKLNWGRVREPKSDFLLSGMASCASCGSPLVGGRGGADARRMYRCSKRCDEPVALSAEPLERYVAERFLAGLRGLRAEGAAATEELHAAEADLQQAEAELTTYLAAVSAADVGAAAFGAGARQRREAVDDARRARDELCERDATAELIRTATVEDDWTNLDGHERRTLLAAGLERIEVQRGRAPIHERVEVIWRT
jgi:site-specific DNA recombinase